jgi:hypothetical protein
MTTAERDYWEHARELTKKHASGKFVRLQDGEGCVGAFTGAPCANARGRRKGAAR